jgi:hypothetical protein
VLTRLKKPLLLPLEERHALASWLNELEYDAWDKQMVTDLSPGGRGMHLLEKVKREIAESKPGPLQAGPSLPENQRQRSRK